MKEIEQIEHGKQWIEDGALLDGNISVVPRLLRDSVLSYLGLAVEHSLGELSTDDYYEMFIDDRSALSEAEQISQIVRGHDFDYNELSVDLRCYLSYLGEWLQDRHEELREGEVAPDTFHPYPSW